MEFNPRKCEVLHFKRLNVRGNYTVNGKTLNSIDMQRDLGVQFHSSLKQPTQVDRVVKAAYGMLAFIARGTEYNNQEVIMQLYWTLVKLHLEQHVRFWLPHYRKYMEALSRVQRRFLWIRELQLLGEVGQTWIIFSGASEVEERLVSGILNYQGHRQSRQQTPISQRWQCATLEGLIKREGESLMVICVTFCFLNAEWWMPGTHCAGWRWGEADMNQVLDRHIEVQGIEGYGSCAGR